MVRGQQSRAPVRQTSAEPNIMTLVTAGLMNKRVAAELGISEVTVKIYRHKIVKKLGARSFSDLVRMADARSEVYRS